MKIYHTPDDFVRLPYAVVTSGTFDGVHLGHQKILSRLKEISARNNGETVVITFWPHPRLVLRPDDRSLRLLNTFEEKAELLREQGIQHLVRIPFTREFSNLTSEQFIRQILIEKLGTRKLVIGYDHRFGKNREGSFEELRAQESQYGFEVEEIPRQDIDHVAVSSTRIRKALEEGDVTTAWHGLGRPYALQGRVVRGDQLGRSLGFPTANIDVDFQLKLIPSNGIYAVRVHHEGQEYDGMLYIGKRPTVGGTHIVIEVNIFDFNKDIYGDSLQVDFVKSIRQDARFKNLDGLRHQLESDRNEALKILRA